MRGGYSLVLTLSKAQRRSVWSQDSSRAAAGMHTENPFEVSKLCSGTIQADSPFTGPGMFRVEGDVLVCGHPMVLPRIYHPHIRRTRIIEESVA